MDAHIGIIRLNVGGQIFETTTQTLCKEPDSFLARFCEIDGMLPSVKDASGAFFIDRDPRYFRIILNYLRSDSIDLEDSVSLETIPHVVQTVSVNAYRAKSSRWHTKFTSIDRGLLRQIASVDTVQRYVAGQPQWRLDGDTLIVYGKNFSIAEVSEMLGKCGLVLRHVEKTVSATGNDIILHFSST